jgi:hypothetical protein
MATDFYCNNCGENLGKDSQLTIHPYCGTCGNDAGYNSYGDPCDEDCTICHPSTSKQQHKVITNANANTAFSDYVQSLINKQVAVQTSKVRTQQQHNKEEGERVYTFTNANLALTSNPDKVRALLATYLQKQTVAQVAKNKLIRASIAKQVNISTARAAVLIRDNINKVAAQMQAK